ncbi:hypothetical protein K523DRAFT_422477 [Schizophyllum commune Tattone D]|nr:hypothetical protein K525DRAFT_275788 [Schizophyllum commune Loenen D]KAI5821574.1 hypothetical protein K523DRAFT_422477 [Schizophyllum commune Tattone D]
MFAYYLSPSTTPSDLQSFCLAFTFISLTTSAFKCSPLLGFNREFFVFEHELLTFEHKYLDRCLLRDSSCSILTLSRHRPSSSNLVLALSSPPP